MILFIEPHKEKLDNSIVTFLLCCCCTYSYNYASILYHSNFLYCYPWAVYCDRPTQLYLKGRGGGAKQIVVAHFPEASAWGVFVRRLRRRFRPEEFFFGRRFTVKAHSTNMNTNTDTNTDLPILKILRFVNFGRKLLRPKPLESVPVKVRVKVFLRIIFARKLASSPTAGVPD